MKELLPALVLILLCCDNTIAKNQTESSAPTESKTNFETDLSDNQTEYQGRSAKSLNFDLEFLSANNDKEGGREARIINDKDISIKGFIPIVGFNNDKHDSEESTKKNQNFDSYGNFYPEYNQKRFAQSTQTQKHVPRPEDQRFIGAALQGLTASLAGKPSRKQGYDSSNVFSGQNSVAPNEGCVCVPFYMCKNGYLTEGKSTGLKAPNIQTAQSIIKQFAIPAPLPIVNKHRPNRPTHQNPFEQYLPIDERSNDDLVISPNEPSVSVSAPNNVSSVKPFQSNGFRFYTFLPRIHSFRAHLNMRTKCWRVC